MGLSHFTKFMIGLMIAASVMAEDVSVQSLSDGACWYEQGDSLRIASFNDKESILTTRDEIEYQVEELLYGKKRDKALTSDLTLHCGGYGSSLVVKSEFNNRPVCLWLKLNKGKLQIRSMGGLEQTKNELCDGYKWGELVVGLKFIDQKHLLESEQFHSMIKSVSVISGTTMKVVLKDEFHGKEYSVMDELKKYNLKYVELNFYQHPVGEAATLK